MLFKDKAIVANTGDDTLSLVDLENKNVLKLIDLKETKRHTGENNFIGPYDMVFTEEGYLYSTNIYNNSIYKIDIQGGKVIDILHVGSFPSRINSYKGNLFVVNSDSNSVSIIDEKTFTLSGSISVEEKPVDMDIDREQLKLYTINSNSHSITVIDLLESKSKTIRLDYSPIKIILEDDLMYLLSIVDNGLENESNISVINKNNKKVKENIRLKGIFHSMLKINNKEIVFVTGISDGYLYRMDIKKGNLLNKVYMKGMPNRLEWDGNSMLLITNLLTNKLILFDMNTNAIVGKIQVGMEPNGVLFLG